MAVWPWDSWILLEGEANRVIYPAELEHRLHCKTHQTTPQAERYFEGELGVLKAVARSLFWSD